MGTLWIGLDSTCGNFRRLRLYKDSFIVHASRHYGFRVFFVVWSCSSVMRNLEPEVRPQYVCVVFLWSHSLAYRSLFASCIVESQCALRRHRHVCLIHQPGINIYISDWIGLERSKRTFHRLKEATQFTELNKKNRDDAVK